MHMVFERYLPIKSPYRFAVKWFKIEGFNDVAFSRTTIGNHVPRAIMLAALACSGLLLTPLSLPQSSFRTAAQGGKLTSLKSGTDPNHTEFIATDASLGDVNVVIRTDSGWQSPPVENLQSIGPTGRKWQAGPLSVSSTFRPDGNRLIWQIDLRNTTDRPVEVGGLSTPLPFQTRRQDNSKPTVFKHSFVSGASSFLFYLRLDSKPPFLMLTPLQGSAPEYWSRGPGPYQVFFHSASEKDRIRSQNGSWRLPQTSRTLVPGETARYGFALQFAKDYGHVRELLATNGKLDVQVAPGMTIPRDLQANIAFRSTVPVTKIEAEFPTQTKISKQPNRGKYQLFRIEFKRLGENRLTVHQANGGKTYLEFFSTLPVEHLIHKRGAFIAEHQIKNSGKWYEGLLAEWNMSNSVQLSPDNYDLIRGWRIYAVTCDDPGLSKPGFLAAKNVEYPVQAEVEALDHYIDKFVWGGLQQTDEEKFPFGIYGIPDWKQNRESKDSDRNKGVDHVWRPYDYPHITLMYHSMHRIAKMYPNIKTRLSAKEYLRRAHGTAVGMFTIPLKVTRWSAYRTGFYNELIIPALIVDLKRAGMEAEAIELEAHWAKKTKSFVAGRVDLFQSEYAFDSTGFETTQALADYAIQNQKRLGLQQEQTSRFLESQMAANLFCRGFIEPAYYYLGSDYRGGGGDGYTLTYMSQMGGWAVMRYGLAHAKIPWDYIRSGSQSFLSAWALMNAGDTDSNYGYWYPGKEHDGGAGGGFEPSAFGQTWLGQPHGRGSWYYSCEIDLGFSGALRAARTVLAEDPIFGVFAYCGQLLKKANHFEVVPKDGVRRRFSARLGTFRMDVELTGAQFAPATGILVRPRDGTLSFQIAKPGRGAVLSASGKPGQSLVVRANGRLLKSGPDGTILDVNGGETITIRAL
jgi:hypothetical protein